MTPDHPVIPWLTEPRRAWLYRIFVAASVLAVVLGVTTDTTAAAVLGLGAAFIGNGLAAANTST